ncbi:MAG TPA: signal peptide peptidase SppA [Hyphomicrobiaceae bacterium]|nr:signal peptide peptidase SppA [Hyphomicrobiaceae bacterium]
MTFETETVLDRRRMRRRLSFWRSAAIAGLALAFGLLAFGGERISDLAASHQIARVTVEGTITEDRDQLLLLKRLRDAGHVEALLVFVNSPGGTTAGGESLFQALRNVAEKKPVVAQFGTVAASAGYIVGLGTDHIVSHGNTITGSIGVLAQWPEVSALLDKIGVKVNEVKSGELKAEPSPFKPMDAGGRQVVQNTIDDGFRWFLSLVEQRRGIIAANVPGLVEGRIFSGREALERKLVDEIGGETEAVRWLEEKRGVTKDLKVIDWKPVREGTWGLPNAMAELAAYVLGAGAGQLARLVGRDATIGTLGLDGLVSVWQP